MKSEEQIRNYIEALKKRKELDLETEKMVELFNWILGPKIIFIDTDDPKKIKKLKKDYEKAIKKGEHILK